jgi:hypothetical protein
MERFGAMISDTSESPEKYAGPPPYRWVKGFAIFAGALLVMLVILWFWWAHVASTQLQTKIDAILARHEPLYPSDFLPPPLPDNQNAATYYRAAVAAKAPNVDSPGSSNYSFNNYPPFPRGWYQLADAAVAANPKALALVHQARTYNAAVWVPRFSLPAIQTLLPHLNEARDLANLVVDAGLDAHLHGDDAEAIERIRDALYQSRTLNDFTIVSRLVSIGIQSLALDRLEVMTADDLQIQTRNSPATSSGHQTRRAVPRQIVVELIRELLDEETPRHWRRNALLGERMIQLDTAAWYENHATLLRPLFNLEAVRCLDKDDYDLRAIEQLNWPAAKAVLATAPAFGTGIRFPATPPSPVAPRFSRILTSQFLGKMNRYIETEFRATAERRIAAVMLAARLYHVDHGQWPRNLDELTPAYLPRVPSDPFLAADAPIGYSVTPNGENRPMIYFDPPGYATTNAPPGHPCFTWQTDGLRQWRDLTTTTLPPPDAGPP